MIEDIGKYYIYRHVREDTSTVFYVGVGTKYENRSSHKWVYYRAYSKKDRSDYWERVASKAGYTIDILLESNDREFILEKEKEFISTYGRLANDTGSLVNFSIGGTMPYPSTCINNNNFIKNSKQVYLYNINGAFIKKFKSHTDTAIYLGVTTPNVSIPFRNRYSSGDYIYSDIYLGESYDFSNYNIKKQKTPICKLDKVTKEVLTKYDSVNAAADAEGINKYAIYDAIRLHQVCKNSYWIKAKDISTISEIVFVSKNKKVYRIDSIGCRKDYFSVNDAAKDMSVNASSISLSIKNGGKCKGYNFYLQ